MTVRRLFHDIRFPSQHFGRTPLVEAHALISFFMELHVERKEKEANGRSGPPYPLNRLRTIQTYTDIEIRRRKVRKMGRSQIHMMRRMQYLQAFQPHWKRVRIPLDSPDNKEGPQDPLLLSDETEELKPRPS